MNEKTVLITGAAGSIGKPMSIEFAKRGATVVMAGRDKNLKDVVEDVKKLSGSEKVEFLQLDLSSLDSVRKAADEFKKRFKRLDVLINNAAVFSKDRKVTADGFEMTFGVNHLGHFLLTNLLAERLKSTPGSRVIVMTMPTTCTIDFDDLQLKNNYSGMSGLQHSKAANTCFTIELAKRIREAGVMVNAVSPELTKSSLPREAALPIRLLFAAFGASPEKSKDYPVRLACNDEFSAVTGRFFKKDKEIPVPSIYSDPKVTARLWEISERLTGLS